MLILLFIFQNLTLSFTPTEGIKVFGCLHELEMKNAPRYLKSWGVHYQSIIHLKVD